MATDIELNTKINTANSAQTIGELNKALKSLISSQAQFTAGTEDYKKLQKAINETEGKIGDLKDGFTTLRGSGVERLTASFGLLREGLGSGDLDKAKMAFKGLGAAMGAIPIFLVIEGFKLLIDNFQDVIKFFGLGIKESDRLAASLENQKKVNEGLFAAQENQIKLLEAQGASTDKITEATKRLNDAKIKAAKDDIELQKLKIREIFLNDTINDTISKRVALGARQRGDDKLANAIEQQIYNDKIKRSKELVDQIRTDLITINNLQTESKIKEINAEKKQNEDIKKSNKERVDDEKRKTDELFAELNKNEDAKVAAENAAKDRNVKQEEERKKNLEVLKQERLRLDQEEIAAFKAKEDEKLAIAKASAQAEEALKNQRLGIANDLINGLGALGIKNRAFANTIFLTQKALAIAGVVVDSQKEQAGYAAAYAPIPGGAAISAPLILGAKIRAGVRIASILATTLSKYINGGGESSTSVGSGSSGSGSTAPPTPSSLAFNNSTVNQVGGIGGNQAAQVNKVILVSHDVTKAQKDDATIKAQTTFP